MAQHHDEIDDLKHLPVGELRRLWQRRFVGKQPPRTKHLLLHDLAWNAQQSRHGAIDAPTRALLRAAVRQACATSAEPGTAERTATPPTRRSRVSAGLPTGTRLLRMWGGVQHEVTVHDEGKRFEYRGVTYRSLTQIAKVITGAHWSGPRFFGLHRTDM